MGEVSLSDVLVTANNTIEYSSNVVTYGLGAIAIIMTVLTISIQIYLARDKKKQIKNAIENILKDIGNNEDLRTQFIQEITKNEAFQRQFNALIDDSINDKLDDKIKDYLDNNSTERIFFEGVQNE